MRAAGAAVIERWHGVFDSVFLAGDVYSATAALAIPKHRLRPAKPPPGSSVAQTACTFASNQSRIFDVTQIEFDIFKVDF